MLENTLRLLGSLQQIANLFCGGHARSQFFSKQQGEFVAQQDQAGIGRRNREHVVLLLEWNEVVAEHQVRGNGAEKFRIDALFAQIDEGHTIAFR